MRKKVDKQCIMLAAGLSSRMGKWKMMMPWGEGTILDSAPGQRPGVLRSGGAGHGVSRR